MALVHIVVVLALLQFVWFGILVGKARMRHGVKAPATTGNAEFERVHRVHMNTLECLVVFIPAIFLFGAYVDTRWAAGLGVVYLIGRFVYSAGYSRAPEKRSAGYGLSMLPVLVLLVGGLIGAIRALA